MADDKKNVSFVHDLSMLIRKYTGKASKEEVVFALYFTAHAMLADFISRLEKPVEAAQ